MRTLSFCLSFGLCLWLSSAGFSQTITNVGTDFWIAFPPNSGGSTLKIFISSEVATTGQVSSAFPGVDQNFSVIPGTVTEVSLPTLVQLIPGIENKGIHITSIDPIAVYGLNRKNATTDAFMALPVTSLGTDYRIMSYIASNSVMGSGFAVAATQNGTTLTIYNKWANITYNETLNAGETYLAEGTTALNDVTGSRIQSNLPVAVYGSVRITTVPNGCFAADHIIEQMWPVTSWGKNFVTVPLAGRDASGDVFRVLAAEDATVIQVNGIVVSTLNMGEHYEAILTGYNSITASKAVDLEQYAKGYSCSGGLTGDPFMMIIPPREQFLTHYTIGTALGFATHWTNLVAPSYALGTIYEDGMLIPNGAFTQIGSTSYYGAQRSIAEGSHTYNSIHPFGVFVYGWNTADSYGYPGGGSMSPIGTVNSVTISPATASGIVNVSTICFTAHVEDDLSNPVAGVLVNFNISGISAISGTAYTDALGDANYCYARTGITSGTDDVYAECFGFISTTSTATWTYVPPPCINPASSGTITGSQTGCGSYTAAPLIGVIPPAGYTGTLEYKWQQSITGSLTGFSDIAGSNAPDYAPGIVTQTTWYRRLARVDCMSDWTDAAMTDALEITVNTPLIPAVTIAVDLPEVCAGETVTFTATPVNGGMSPGYQWKVNGTNAGANLPVYSFVPLNGDQVMCVVTSGIPCVANNPASSNSITMVVNPNLPAGITIVASPNPFCLGSAVTLTASPSNGGFAPIYQWQVNGINTGANSSTFTYNPVNNDLVRCIMTSGLTCVTGSPASSANVIMNGLSVPMVSFASCSDTVTTLGAKPFKLRGGLPLGGSYSGPGVNPVTGIFTPSAAGIGIKSITYTYLNVSSCSDFKTRTIRVHADPAFTCGGNFADIRDGRSYPTVLIGTQCWMKENLDFGFRISDLVPQTDNCIPEFYKNPNSGILNPKSVYQWDELMQYQTTEGSQGLCPPGWHVPTETEWTTLVDYYLGNGSAGRPLQDTFLNEFNALRHGVFYLNSSWSFTDFATIFWSSTSSGPSTAISHGMNLYDFSVSLYPGSRVNAFSVRCMYD